MTLNLLDLPAENVFHILLQLPVDVIVTRCRTSGFFQEICDSESFWLKYAKEHVIHKTHSTWRSSVEATVIGRELTVRIRGKANMYDVLNDYSALNWNNLSSRLFSVTGDKKTLEQLRFDGRVKII